MSVRTHTPTLGALAALALLSACGGGGGDTQTPVDPIPVAQEITDANGNQVASAVVSAVDASRNVQTMASAFGVPGGASAYTRQAASARGVAEASRPDKLQCAQGGLINLTHDDKNNDTFLTVGESLDAQFQSCVEEGQTYTGGLALVLDALSGDFLYGTGEVGYTATFREFGARDSVGRYTASGTMGVSFAQTSRLTSQSTLTLQNFVTSEYTSSSALRFRTTVTSAAYSVIDDGVNVSTSFQQQLVVVSTPFGGTLTVTTEAPVVVAHASTDGKPASGRVRATTGKSTAWVTYLGGDWVRLELDTNNDGTLDATRTVSLTELDRL